MGSGKKSLMVCGSRRRKRNSPAEKPYDEEAESKQKQSISGECETFAEEDAGRECGGPKITISAATNNAGRDAACRRSMMRVER